MLNWQAHKKLRIFIKTVCIVLIVCFLAYDLSWAKAGEALGSKSWQPAAQNSNPSAIVIPQELGVIKDSYTSKYNSNKLVIHIQDAHANVEAQENEAKLIKYLKDKYKVSLVSVEGGFGDFDADFFRSFPKDKKVREKIAKYFLSKAFISGADYLLITENDPPSVYGAEDKELYASHLNTFRDNQRISDSINQNFGVLEDVIATLKNKYYSKDLKEFDSYVNDFKEGRIALEEYLSYLNITSIIHGFDLSKFPTLFRIISLQELEHKINFDQAEVERQELIDSLTKALSKPDLEELVKKSLDFKADKLMPAEYYIYLEELTKKAGIAQNNYSNLFSYIKYINLSQDLDNSRLFEEIDAFTNAVKEKLLTNSVQKDLDSLTYIIRILKGLSDINLSPKDYEYFKKNRDAFSSKNIGLALREYTNSSILNSLPTDQEIASLEKFYSLAFKRDNAMISNSLNRLNRDYSANSLILVAGGFHTQGITSVLKEKDISYIVIAPSIKTTQEKETVYFSFLKDKKLPLQDVLNDPDTLQIINSITDPQARQVLINYWVARSTRYYSVKEIQGQLRRLTLSNEDQQAAQLALGEFTPSTVIVKKDEKEVSSPIIPRQPREEKTSLAASAPAKPESLQAAVPSAAQDSFITRALTALKKRTKRIFLSLAIASIFFTSQPAMAHYFAANPQGTPQAVVQVWHRDTPAEDTLGGIARDVLRAQGQKPTSALLYGKDGLVNQLANANNLANPNLLRPNQPITLPFLDIQAANKLLGRTEEQPVAVTPVSQTPQVTPAPLQPEKAPAPETPAKVITPSQPQAPQVTPMPSQAEDKSQVQERLVKAEQQLTQALQENQAAKQAVERLTSEQEKAKERISSLEGKGQSLEQKVSDLEKRLDTTEQRVTQAEEKHPEFKEYAANWWKGLNSGWKAALSILAVFGAGLGLMRLYVQRKWSRLRELKDDLRKRQADKDRLDEEIDASREQLAAVRADLQRSQRALEEAGERRKVQEKALAKSQARADTLEAKPSSDDSLRQAIERLEREVASRKSSITKEISDEEARLASLRKELEELEKEHRHYEERITQLQIQAKALEDELRVLEQTKASQEAGIQEETARAKAQLEETRQTLLQAQQNLSALASNLESLGTKKKASEEEIVALEAKRVALEKDLSKLTQQQEELSRAIAVLNTQKQELAEEQAVLEQAAEDKKNELENLERKIKGLETKGAKDDTQIVSLEERKIALETEIAKLSRDLSDLYKERGQSAQETERLKEYLFGLERQRQELEAAIQALQADKKNLSAEVSALQAQRNDLAAEVERARQNAASFQQDSQTKTASLDAETAQRQKQLEDLRTKAVALAAQKSQLEQELSDLSRRKEQETQALEQALKQKQEIEQQVVLLNTQLEEARQEIENLTAHLEELKARKVSLDTEVPALTRRREALEEETARLQRTKEELEQNVSALSAEVRPAGAKAALVELAKPYSVMMFDIDGTLTNIVTDIDRSMLGELVAFLEKGVYIVLISMQGRDEIYKHVVEPFYSYYGVKKELLEKIIIYTSGGAECYRFDRSGNIFKEKGYDPLKNSIFEKEIPGEDDRDKEWNQAFVEDAIKARLLEHGYRNINLTNVRQDQPKRHGAITISVRKQEDRSKVSAILTDLFSEKGWHLQPRLGGRHTIHVLIGGVNKATAAEHSLRMIEHDVGTGIPYEQVFFAGDSFSAGGLDTDVISVLPGGHIISVGRKPDDPALKNLQKLGLIFSEDLVGDRGWKATKTLLSSVSKTGKDIQILYRLPSRSNFITRIITSAILFVVAFAVLSLPLFLFGNSASSSHIMQGNEQVSAGMYSAMSFPQPFLVGIASIVSQFSFKRWYENLVTSQGVRKLDKDTARSLVFWLFIGKAYEVVDSINHPRYIMNSMAMLEKTLREKGFPELAASVKSRAIAKVKPDRYYSMFDDLKISSLLRDKEQLLRLSPESVQELETIDNRIWVLIFAALEHLKNNSVTKARELLQKAQELSIRGVNEYDNSYSTTRAHHLAFAQLKAGLIREALDTLKGILLHTEGGFVITDFTSRYSPLLPQEDGWITFSESAFTEKLLLFFMQAGYCREVEEIIDSCADTSSRNYLYFVLSRTLGRVGLFEDSRRVISKINNEEERDYASINLLIAFGKHRRWDDARILIHKITDKQEAQNKLIDSLLESNLLDDAYQEIRTLDDGKDRQRHLRDLAVAYARIGNSTEARKIADRISDKLYQDQAFEQIIYGEAISGLWNAAYEDAMDYNRMEVWLRLAEISIRQNNEKDTKRCLEEAKKQIKENTDYDDLIKIGMLQVELGLFEEAIQTFSQAHQDIIDNEDDGDEPEQSSAFEDLVDSITASAVSLSEGGVILSLDDVIDRAKDSGIVIFTNTLLKFKESLSQEEASDSRDKTAKRREQGNSDHWGRNLTSIFLILSTAFFSLFPSFASFAENASPPARVQTTQTASGQQGIDSLAESLDTIFNHDTYAKNITRIDKAIELIRSRKVSDPRIIKALQWVIVKAVLSDGRYYPDTTKQAVLALLDLEQPEGWNGLAEAIKDPLLIKQTGRLTSVLEVIAQSKTNSSTVLEALRWVMLNSESEDKSKYYPNVVKAAAKALIQLGDPGIKHLIGAFNQDSYRSGIKTEVFDAIAEAGLTNPDIIKKLHWVIFEASWKDEKGVETYYGGHARDAGRALYRIQGDKALETFSNVLQGHGEWRWLNGTAEAVVAVATDQKDHLTLPFIIALQRVAGLRAANDNKDGTLAKAAKELLEKAGGFAPFSAESYITHPEVIIKALRDLKLVNPVPPALVGQVATVLLYTNADGSVNPDITASAIAALFRAGDTGRQALAGIFNSQNYQERPRNLKAVLETLTDKNFPLMKVLPSEMTFTGVEMIDSRLRTQLESFVLEPADPNGQYVPELNKTAVQALLYNWRYGDSKGHREKICGLFTPENYLSKPAQLALIIDTLSETGLQERDVLEKFFWVAQHVPADGAANLNLLKSALRSLANWKAGHVDYSYFLPYITHSDEEIRSIAIDGLARDKSYADKVRPYLQSEDMLARASAREVLERISPETKGTIFISEEEARVNLFSYQNHHAAAQALREFNQDKPFSEKAPAYLLSYLANTYIWLSVLLGIGGVILAITLATLSHEVNKVYKRLLAYAGHTTFRERLTLRRIAVSLVHRESYGIYDPVGLIARNLPNISKTSKIKQIEKLAVFLDKLNKAGVNSQYILEHGIPLVSRIAKNETEFDKGLVILEDLAVNLRQHGSDIRNSNIEVNNLGKLISDLGVFEAFCGFVKDSFAQNKQAAPELLTAVVPEAFKGAKDTNRKVVRLQIIRQLVLGGLHPTQLLIETLEKTTSQSQISEQIARWKKLLSDLKSGAVHFDPNNPLHVDLEYNTYRQLAPQVSLSTSYNDYKDFIKKFHSSTGPGSSLGSQEAGEIRLAVYEAMRLLEFIITVKQKADKLGRPIWIVPNKSYGSFAVSPIIDELARLGVEIHYAKIGSTESHENPTVFNQSLFTDDIYLRIIKEQPILIVVDGTQHTAPRVGDGKASRYPDAYQGYRNFVVALDEVICGRKEEKFVDQVLTVDKDHLSNLRQTPAYASFVDRLERLTSGVSLPASLYRLQFWNPGGRNLILRENRKEVVWENKKFTLFDISNLNSPVLIFVSCSMLDEDIPPDIKKWSGLEGTHQPAFFDDKGQIQQNALAINGRGLYLTHALEFEISRASQQLKGFYKGKLPQVEYQEPTPEDIRSSYEAMLFDLDGTLTETLKDIDNALLDKLIYLLSSGVIIGIVTSQSLDEVKAHILDKVDSDKKQHLGNLFLYANRGVQVYNFDGKVNPILVSDRSRTDVSDEQRALIRQLVNQALGTLAGTTNVIDRGAQLSIHLDKHKDKRDLVNTTLSQLIAANNLPFQTEYSGTSTIHVVLKGADKGAAKDNFLTQILPSRLNRQPDVSRLLIVGDRFAQAGSDQPMIVQGARVVSVGKEKGLPGGIENYPAHGWRGTDQLLGEIIHKAGKTTVSSPAAFFVSLSLSDLWQNFNASLDGLYDTSKRPLLYAGIAVLGLAFVFVSAISAIKLYKTSHLYREIIKAVSFLERKDRIFLFREVSRHLSWKKIEAIDAYQLFVDILPVLSRGIKDKRIQEISNMAGRLRKAKLNLRHVFKYCLPAVVAKAKDEKEFLSSLTLAERFVLTLQDKHYDYHVLLREIFPALTKETRNSGELNEAIILGITLVKSGRNPVFALTKQLPEVVILTKTQADFRLGVYALQELCLEGLEPTRYLLSELIKQGTQAKIDQAISAWQETRRKFKTGEIPFDPKNELYANIEYTTFRELVDRTLKQPRKYSFREYQQILDNYNHGDRPVHLRRTEKAEIKFAAYEAFRFRQFVLEVKRQADRMGKKVWVVPNLSYGRFAVSPIIKDLIADGVEIHPARIGSSESHFNPSVLKPDLFSANLYDRIMNEQPIIIVVDGTQHHVSRNNGDKDSRYPDAYQGYRNLIIAVNDVLSAGQERVFKYLVKREKGFGDFMKKIRKKDDYRALRRRLLRLYQPDAQAKRQLYAVEFWNPGRREIILRENKEKIGAVRPVSASEITQPTLIFVSSVMFDEDIPLFIREWINRDKKVHHTPAYFDDTAHIQNIIFKVDSSGVNLSDEIYADIRQEYKRIKGIYQHRFSLPAKPKDLANLPFKAVISDLDGTLADTLQEVPAPVIEKLLYLLSLGVQVAVVTTQSHKEVEKYFLSQVPPAQKALLSNLTVYAATGSQAFGFDKNGDPLAQPLYNTAGSELTEQQMQTWRKVIDSLFKEYGLDKEAKNKKGQVVAGPARIIDAGSQVIIRLKERGFLRREIRKRLQAALEREQLPIVLKEIGRTSIRMTIKGVDKSVAVKYHLITLCKDRFGFEPKPGEVLILGNSFDEDGDDRDMMVKGARVFSVGGKPFLHHLRGGINFYPQGGWQGSNQLLAEFINFLSNSLEENPKPEAKPELVKLNSFNFLPFLAAGGISENMDPFTSFVVGCLAGIVATILIFRNRIFPSSQPESEEDFEEEPQPNNFTKSAKPQEKTQAVTVRPVRRVLKPYDFDSAAQSIRQQYPGIRIGVIGATAPARGYTRKIGEQLGRKLRRYAGNSGFVFTGGVAGVGVDVYKGVLDESRGADDRFFTLLPEDMDADYEYNGLGPTRVKTVHFGRDMFERRIGMGKVADLVIILNGRGGTLHEAIAALEAGRKVIALDYGGAGSLLYHAKAGSKLHPGLIQQGLKPEYLNNIILADLDNIEEVINAAGPEPMPLAAASRSVLSADEVKNIFKAAIKEPSDDDTARVVGRNATSRWYSAVRRTIKAALRRPVTVYYPGSYTDIQHPLLATDADVFLFADINEDSGKPSARTLANSIARKIVQLGGKIIDIEAANDNEAVVRFEYQDRERVLYYYNNVDASNEQMLPQRIKGGFDIYVEKALINGYTGSGINKQLVPQIALRYLRQGSFLLTDYHAREQVADPRLATVGMEYVRGEDRADWNRFRYLTYFAAQTEAPQAQSDRFSKALFTIARDGNISLSQNAVYAINNLGQVYNSLTLEVDVDTLIDTSKGMPQLKGLGFKEALASLYQAQEKKQIPENVRVRLININPRLNRTKIIKVLGLTEDLLRKMVDIPDIPQDYLIRTLEPYLIAGSIRIIFEDNVRYWGKKVDVLVRRGEETQTLSSLGLIVAALAKEPKFYASLPAEVKEYIAAKTDEKGNIELDDEGNIKEIIFKPIEKTKVDTQYLEQLDKANKELEGMV